MSILGPSDRLLLIGDSLAAGIKAPMRELADAAGIPFQGHGVVGSRIDEWADKYLEPELGFGPTVVAVSLGTNDMKMFDPASQQAAHVQSILERIRGAGARVAWILPPSMPFSDKGVRMMISSKGPDLLINAELLDLARAADKIHMTPSGYKQFAESVWNCLWSNECPGGVTYGAPSGATPNAATLPEVSPVAKRGFLAAVLAAAAYAAYKLWGRR